MNNGNNGASSLFGGIDNDFSNLNDLGSFGNLNYTDFGMSAAERVQQMHMKFVICN